MHLARGAFLTLGAFTPLISSRALSGSVSSDDDHSLHQPGTDTSNLNNSNQTNNDIIKGTNSTIINGSLFQDPVLNSTVFNSTNFDKDEFTKTCHDTKDHNLYQACWDILEVSQYLERWWAENEHGCNTEYAGSSFVSCYQQKHHKIQTQCDTIGPSLCANPTDFVSVNATAQEAYVLYSIFSIWQYFNSLYGAIEDATLTAMGPVGDIVREVNPIKSHVSVVGMLLQAFTAGTPLLTLEKTFTSTFQYLKTAAIPETTLRQAPGVMQQLVPTGTLDSEVVQTFDIVNHLTQIKTTYQQNLTMALQLIQQDFLTFSLFAASGNFIARSQSLKTQTEALTDHMMTYIISQCLTSINMFIALARNTNPIQLSQNGTVSSNLMQGCTTSYDEWGTCGEWWYHPDTDAAYALVDMSDSGGSQREFMLKLFENGWTTPEKLFLGSKACADYQACIGGIGANSPTFDTTTFRPRCISNMQVCVYDQSCQSGQNTCEFTGEFGWGPKKECRPTKGYLIDSCGDSEGTYFDNAVPAAYLGPLLDDRNTNYRTCRAGHVFH